MYQKAFTLIELLVVVAIIGILAAVGVVAYNGYTSAAKVNVTKTNHKNYHKFLMSELTKCNNGLTDKLFGISCPITLTADLIKGLNSECASGSLSKIMNPYSPNTKACRYHQPDKRIDKTEEKYLKSLVPGMTSPPGPTATHLS